LLKDLIPAGKKSELNLKKGINGVEVYHHFKRVRKSLMSQIKDKEYLDPQAVTRIKL